MMFVILQLFVLMTLCWVVQGQCEGLIITGEDGQMNTSAVCHKVYGTQDCLEFYKSFNQSNLPEEYPKSATSVEKPYLIKLDGLDSLHNNDGKIYPGLTVKWRSPVSGTAVKSCYGYLMVWFVTNSNDTKCRLIHMETGINAEFRYDVQYVTQRTDYTVRVYSMPPNKLQFKHDERTFVFQNMKSSSQYQAGNPGYWSPFVMYDTFKNGTISVSFTLPPANFSITHFAVYLMSENDINTPVAMSKYITPIRTEDNTQYILTFTAKDSGSYGITVWAEDEYHMDVNNCRCWIMENGVRTCKNTCGGTTTGYFYLNITEPPKLVPTTTQPAEVSTTLSTPETTLSTLNTTLSNTTLSDTTKELMNGLDPDLLKYIVGGVFGFLALVLFAICLCCLCKRRESVKQLITQWFNDSSGMDKTEIKSALEAGNTPKTSLTPVTRKTVYIMSASDHRAHVELVQSFVTFLQEHCYCNVIIPSENDQRETGAYIWFLNIIKKFDYMIFINSEGAQKLIEAHMSEMIYTKKVSPEDEIFICGLKHIMLNAEVREKQVILVSFHGNHCQQYLQVPEIYKLPKRLPRLLQKIHRLNAEATKLYSYSLPLYADNIPQLDEGARMLSCLKNVETYEKNNPHWFESSFGDLEQDQKHLYNRLVSSDSGCHSLPPDTSDSVSRHITFDSQTPSNLPGTVKLIATGNDMTHEKMKINGDDFSCITINDEQDGKLFQQQQTCQVIDECSCSISPPKTESEIFYDNFSEAIAQINDNSGEPLYHPPSKANNYQDHQAVDVDGGFQIRIIPPDNPSDMNVDSLSSAFADINDNSHHISLKGLAKHLIEQDVDNGYFESEFDSVSI